MERLRNPYSGLGQYCLHLGQAFAANPVQEIDFACLLPEERIGTFGGKMRYKAVKPWHKLLAPGMNAALWHAMHQDSEYLPANRKTPLALTIHDLNFLDRPDYSESKKQRKLKTIQQKINRAKGLVYISEYVQDWVRKHMEIPAGILETVIYNGGAFEPSEQSTKAEKVSEKGEFLFSIGIHPKKNYHVLMPLLKAFPQYRWIIAGPDSRGYRSRIEQEAKKWGVQGLEFCGPVDDAEKRVYYEQCAALLFPSLSEGFGLPVVEAMSLGKPVFLSKRTSLPEIGGKEAYYFDDFEPDTLIRIFDEGMNDFKNDTGKPERMKQWAARFTWEKAAKEYIAFYQKMLQNNR